MLMMYTTKTHNCAFVLDEFYFDFLYVDLNCNVLSQTSSLLYLLARCSDEEIFVKEKTSLTLSCVPV